MTGDGTSTATSSKHHHNDFNDTRSNNNSMNVRSVAALLIVCGVVGPTSAFSTSTSLSSLSSSFSSFTSSASRPPSSSTRLAFGYLDNLSQAAAAAAATTALEDPQEKDDVTGGAAVNGGGGGGSSSSSSSSGMSYLDSLSSHDDHNRRNTDFMYAVDVLEEPAKQVAPPAKPVVTMAAAGAAPAVPAAAKTTTTTPPPPPRPLATSLPPVAVPPWASQTTKEQVEASNTLSATSPTISITLPVGLAPPKLTKPKNIGYGEASRKFRRTVYTHDDWARHRSPDRFVRNLASITSSGVYKNIAKEVFVATGVTALVMLYNGATTGYQDLQGVFHEPVWNSQWLPPLTLPLQPFTLVSPSLGLLLAFRTNTAYQRWDEARKNWGMNINHTRDLVRMGNAYYDRTGVSEEQRKADLERLSLCTWAFVRSMKRHLSPEGEDESNFKAELYERLPKTQAQKIIKAAHRPNRALFDLSMAIENLPMHFMRKNEMHAALTIFEDNLGSSERLLTSPVPLIYNRHTARFLTVFLFILPVALWEPFGFMWNHIGLLPAMSVIALLLFGTEELAVQMEEPFTILPMQAFCDKIGNWCNEIVGWEDGDNGETSKPSYQGHSTVFLPKTTSAVAQQS